MEDKKLICKECGDEFILTIDDQQFYAEKGFKEPKRCKDCRRLRRAKVIGPEGGFHGQEKS